MEAVLAFLTANWLPIVAGVAIVYLLGGDKAKEKIAALKGNVTTDMGDVVTAISNLSIVKQLQIEKGSIERTLQSGMLIKIENYVETLPEAAKAEGRSALEVLAKLVVVPPADPAPVQRKAL